ncbi:MAG: 1,6-anhydro-N-acetylmuramyl-L-alanine amidase AmpD [Pseudomonadota bacterium]|nr:1,6-anhydro-N-acetylmuramyl-L-alanine amidase AmpD [Pseudomonadota bacterium]
MNVDTENGLLDVARQVSSPNCDDRPPGVVPELIVLHNISLPPGEFGGPWIESLFLNTLDPGDHPFFAGIVRLRVSAHLLVERSGNLVQFVPFHRRAWHAGVSSYQGREACNDFTIGIELEGADDAPYDPRQYAVLAAAIEALTTAYPTLSSGRIRGHEHIASGRKTDPGPWFDWSWLRMMLEARDSVGRSG